MKLLIALLATCVSLAHADHYECLGEGFCRQGVGGEHGGGAPPPAEYCTAFAAVAPDICLAQCLLDPALTPQERLSSPFPAFDFTPETGLCNCYYAPIAGQPRQGSPQQGFLHCGVVDGWGGFPEGFEYTPGTFCYIDELPTEDDHDIGSCPATSAPTATPTKETESNGDPHFKTWKNEHFEFHGQCDLVMTKVQNFANKGIDLEIHLRTSIVRYWSYIRAASIRIGNDILEVEGSAAKEDGIAKRHYHINFEHLGTLTELVGYPVTISPRNNMYTIYLDKDFPGQKIEIKTFKEFVGVKIIGATEDSFGNAIGITGNFKNGNTYARDGSTVLHEFNELGLEWQVLPSDGKLFHELARPQFPELCYLPEDPRGDRARRLAESDISQEAAEAACVSLKDEFDRKGCVYDILATQDMDMVGAY